MSLPHRNKNQTTEQFVKNTLLYPDQGPGVDSLLSTVLGQIVMPTGMAQEYGSKCYMCYSYRTDR